MKDDHDHKYREWTKEMDRTELERWTLERRPGSESHSFGMSKLNELDRKSAQAEIRAASIRAWIAIVVSLASLATAILVAIYK